VLDALTEPALLLVLDGVTDPHNLARACATPMRSARMPSSCPRIVPSA
jgi:tRNA G18 (ribose-2'-O)-methylase SpoU